MRQIEILNSGASNSLIAGNGGSSEWVLAVTGGIDGSTALALEASIDNDTWFPATDASGPVVFSTPSAVMVSSGLYYRLNVGTYTSPIFFTIKPN